MPWCDDCDRFWNPNTMGSGGTCPTCSRVLVDPSDEAAVETKAPWHFKLLVLAVVLYLGWRLIQMLGWVIHQF